MKEFIVPFFTGVILGSAVIVGLYFLAGDKDTFMAVLGSAFLVVILAAVPIGIVVASDSSPR